MAQSTTRHTEPRHVAIIMDGNGRWAAQRGWPRPAGHRAGATAVRNVIEAAPELGIGTLSLYAFSSDNWHRPQGEVASLMRLFVRYLRQETTRCVETGVSVSVIGRRDRVPDMVRAAVESCEAATARGGTLHLRLAIDYSARHAIREAACAAAAARVPADDPVAELGRRIRGRAPNGAEVPDVDLLIRTGGEQRLSDFMLWECAYAELYFTPVLWPDFGAAQLGEAVASFRGRERRFGRLGATAAN
jgi:undecaprenyl diphosphate synthase